MLYLSNIERCEFTSGRINARTLHGGVNVCIPPFPSVFPLFMKPCMFLFSLFCTFFNIFLPHVPLPRAPLHLCIFLQYFFFFTVVYLFYYFCAVISLRYIQPCVHAYFSGRNKPKNYDKIFNFRRCSAIACIPRA